MLDLEQTICAQATPPGGPRSIIRITGPDVIGICSSLTKQAIRPTYGIQNVLLTVDPDTYIEARLYVFPDGRSYTGQSTIEIHLDSGPLIAEAIIDRLLASGARHAKPGEFTARAFLIGKMDLASAEAVNQMIAATNTVQQKAAMKIIQQGPGRVIHRASQQLLDILILLEAGMDFPEEQVPAFSHEALLAQIQDIREQLEEHLRLSQRNFGLSHMPSVGLAGLPNAGKSTLFNRLSGAQSLVSPIAGTTRDILEAVIELNGSGAVLFDCPGLIAKGLSMLDRLADHIAKDALNRADAIIFCVDLSKQDWSEDLRAFELFAQRPGILVATKADLLDQGHLDEYLARLAGAFRRSPIAVSAITGLNVSTIYLELRELLYSRSQDPISAHIATTISLRQAIHMCIQFIDQAGQMLQAGSDEVAAMFLRQAYQALCQDQQRLDEQILEQIFGRFCIGK